MRIPLLCVAVFVLSISAAGQLSTAPSAPAAPAAAQQLSAHTFFPVAVWYGGGKARAPMLESVTPQSGKLWREDLEKIRDLGFNTVRTWVEWSSGEPRPGEYHLEQLDLMLELARAVGLKVIVQVYADAAPDWVGRKYPDGHFVAQNGAAIPSQAAPGFCFDHPGVRKAVLDFYREVARHAEKNAAFFAWDLWSEPHVINWAEITYIPHASFCYCPYSLARFREWLREKYSTLDSLNYAWHRNFSNWREVEPPRFDTILSYSDFIDWRVFITEKLAEDLRLRNRAVKEIAPAHPTSSHSAVPGVFTSLAEGEGNPDDWLMYRSVDYYGVSLYPKHSLPPHWSVARLALAMDFTRAASQGRGFYVGELQGGFGVRGDIVSQPITAEDLRAYMWASVARGARAICIYAFYPMSSGYESGGYGLIGLDGTLTERSRIAGETARQIADNADLLLNAKPQDAEVAILFNHLTTLVGGQQHLYNPTALRDSAAGYHRMFFERNIPVDFLSARELDKAQLSRYKLIILPYPIVMAAELSAALDEYVRGGGHLFMEARAGWIDGRGYAQPTIPGFGLDRVAGVREKAVFPQSEVPVRWAQSSFAGARFRETFEKIDPTAHPLAYFDDGSVAAYEHKYGNGSATILGTFAGQINETKPQEQHPLAEFLTSWAGLRAPGLKAGGHVEFRQMIGPMGQLIIFINHDATSAAVEFSAKLQGTPRKLREITTGQSMSVAADVLEIQSDMPPYGVRVYRVDY